MSVTPEGIAAYLNRAADKLEECGWVQGVYGNDDTGYCASGAIREVDESTFSATRTAASCILEAATGTYDMVEWNDRSGQTSENVIATFRRLAAEVEVT